MKRWVVILGIFCFFIMSGIVFGDLEEGEKEELIVSAVEELSYGDLLLRYKNLVERENNIDRRYWNLHTDLEITKKKNERQSRELQKLKFLGEGDGKGFVSIDIQSNKHKKIPNVYEDEVLELRYEKDDLLRKIEQLESRFEKNIFEDTHVLQVKVEALEHQLKGVVISQREKDGVVCQGENLYLEQKIKRKEMEEEQRVIFYKEKDDEFEKIKRDKFKLKKYVGVLEKKVEKKVRRVKKNNAFVEAAIMSVVSPLNLRIQSLEEKLLSSEDVIKESEATIVWMYEERDEMSVKIEQRDKEIRELNDFVEKLNHQVIEPNIMHEQLEILDKQHSKKMGEVIPNHLNKKDVILNLIHKPQDNKKLSDIYLRKNNNENALTEVLNRYFETQKP